MVIDGDGDGDGGGGVSEFAAGRFGTVLLFSVDVER